jgi:exonuclease VII large subunit
LIVRQPADVAVGDELRIQLARGEISVTVSDSEGQ